jgi:hypothetical protein
MRHPCGGAERRMRDSIAVTVEAGASSLGTASDAELPIWIGREPMAHLGCCKAEEAVESIRKASPLSPRLYPSALHDAGTSPAQGAPGYIQTHRKSSRHQLGCFDHRCRLVRALFASDSRVRAFDVLRQSRGIGLESSLLFAQEGANVLLVDVNVAAVEKAAKLVSERSPNIKAVALKADVSKEAEIKSAVDKAVELFGRLDVVVCQKCRLSNCILDPDTLLGLVQQCWHYAP